MKRSVVLLGTVVCLFMFLAGPLAAATPAMEGAVNINTATLEELQMLPGIGESIAQNIVDFRNANGPFASIDELIKVKGIGVNKLDAIRDNLTLEGPTTLRIIE